MSTYKKIFSLALLLSVVAAAQPGMQAAASARSYNSSCSSSSDCSSDCSSDSCSSDCSSDNCSTDCSTDNSCSSDCGFSHGRTHFSPRSITFDSAYELALTNYHVYHSNNYCGPRSTVALYFTPFYQQSTRSRRNDRFFQTSSQASSAATASTGSTALSGFGRLRPERRVYGSLFTMYADLGCLYDGAWLSINTAAVGVEQKLRSCGNSYNNANTVCDTAEFDVLNVSSTIPCDTTFDTGTGTACNMRRCKRRAGLDDIQVKLGYDYFLCSNDHIGLYLVGGIPTGRRHHGEMFEALIGSRHGSLGFGLNGDYTFWQGGTSDLVLMADFKYRYVFEARERRTVDFDTTTCREIRECLRVKPRSTIDFWTALHYQYCNWGVEVGYDLFWRQRETICPNRLRSFNNGTTVADTLSTNCEGGLCDANNVSVESFSGNDDFNFGARCGNGNCGGETLLQDVSATTSTQTTGLSTHSARQGRVLNHKVYGGLSYNTAICNYPTLLGVVGSYEFSRCRGSFDNWAVYGKIGVQF